MGSVRDQRAEIAWATLAYNFKRAPAVRGGLQMPKNLAREGLPFFTHVHLTRCAGPSDVGDVARAHLTRAKQNAPKTHSGRLLGHPQIPL